MADRGTDTPHGTVIEPRSSGGTVVIALALLVALAILGVFLFNQSRNDKLRTDAAAGAAKDVGDSAKRLGRDVTKAANGPVN